MTLIPSVPYLQRWLSHHPVRDDPDPPLWCKLNRPEELGDDMPITFTNFRKISASYLASQGMNQAHIEDHHRWVRGSGVATQNVSVFGGDADRELRERHDVEDATFLVYNP